MTTRRRFLQAAGGLAGTWSPGRAVAGPAAAAPAWPQRPNILVLMTDQERHHTHWPAGWVDANLPSFIRLQRHGLTFHRAYTAASECSPSRAAMMTSQFAPVNRVARTLLWPGLPGRQQRANVGSLLREQAGYHVVWKGKWHLSFARNTKPGMSGETWTRADIAHLEHQYGLAEWNPPDAGIAIQERPPGLSGYLDGLATLGGGKADNDGRYVSGPTPGAVGQTPGIGGESVLDFLARARTLGRPFCLFVSLVNPHDIGFYPDGWKDAGYRREDFATLGIDLPPNLADDLSSKPQIQSRARTAFDASAPLADLDAQRDYVNFYAYLHTIVDRRIGAILDALEAHGLSESTVVLRLSDHGELGLSHGMREKSYSAYEEMIHIPLVVSNPLLYPEPRETQAFYSHLDLLPTLAELAGVPQLASYGLGKSIAPVLRDPSASVQDSVLFCYDDVFRLPAGAAGANLRTLRERDWAYSVYFGIDGSGIEYELYDLATDPLQMKNLLHGSSPAEVRAEWARLHELLTGKLVNAANLPVSFPWPIAPAA
ncbi:MAG: sulfatase-like hydrolase/transferase [Hyphomicrobiales bacterium]|nr:sulfatase-like hydrolase/transferase [Hyphomicrobiales bacterium]